jgi:hypothetical protein
MSFVKGASVLLIVAVTLGGCAKQTFLADTARIGAPDSETKSQFFLSGIGQEDIIDATDACGGAENILAVESELDPMDAVLGFVSFGIYTPRTMRVYCK